MFEIYYSDNDYYNLSIPGQGVEPRSDLAGHNKRDKKCRPAREVCNIIELDECFIEMSSPGIFLSWFLSPSGDLQ